MKKALRITTVALLAASLAIRANAVEVLFCEPLLAVFCDNLHVACAGRSSIPTVIFRVVFDAGRATVTSEGEVDWSPAITNEDGSAIVPSPYSKDWIKIEGDGRFSHRIYRNGGARMSIGRCS